MATQEVVVDQKPVDLAPVDPNVTVPKHVREAAARAEQTYKQAYPQPEAPPAEPVVAVPSGDLPPVLPAAPPAPDPAAPPSVPPIDWEQRYNSMKGRWQANERMMGDMRAQMDQMAAELQRSQSLMHTNPDHQNANPDITHENVITPEEVDTYGPDMINVARKVAIQTLAPEIQRVQADNVALRNQILEQGRRDMRAQLDATVPNWGQIVNSPEWANWIRLPNVYTGEVRGKVLEAARQAANAPRVIAIFKDFLRDTVATGGQVPGTQVSAQLPPQEVQAPREPAIPIGTLAAPGKARPATGNDLPTTPATKPTYTRHQIAKFYDDSRRGVYAGRETEKARIEADIYEAQREGRVR